MDMVMRVTGLASGMNIDEIVENLIKAESIPLDKMKQDKTLLEWKRDAYREMNTELLNFRSELTNMRLSSFYRTRSVTSTNESLVSATVASGAGKGTYTISNISQLARAAYYVNAGAISTNENFNPSNGLYAEKDNFAYTGFTDWREGSVETKSIIVKDAGTSFSLELEAGTEIIDAANLSVKVNGKRYEVVTSMPSEGLADNQVLVNTATGELTFKNTIDKNSTIKVDYVTNQRIETKTITEDTTSITLRGALKEDSVSITMGDKTLTTSGNSLLYNSTTVGTIDYSTGKITFNDDFKSLVQEEMAKYGSSEDDEDQPKLDIKITSKQYYTSFDLTTYNTDGSQNKETFFIQGAESLNSVISRVNGSDAGVTMYYDSFTGQMTITRNETGNLNSSDSDIELEGAFINKLLQFESGTYEDGKNAIFEINGLRTERTSNAFSMNGVTFTLKNTTIGEDGNDTGERITVNVNDDTETLFENIKSFVEKYNELIEKIEEKLNEPKYKDYLPLTDDEREQLTESQQEKWEEMAKSGLLRNDSILSSFITNSRTSIYSPVTQDDMDPTLRSLSAIGITTTTNYLSGKLEINETALKEAIEKDPESIEKLFIGTGESDSQKGIIRRLTDQVNATMDLLKERAGNTFSVNHQFTIGKQLDVLEDRIEAFEDRLTVLETRYYNQFAAMETAIQNANSQAAYLAQLFFS
ncbi:flagellar filament capping protein FliD [Fervidibacillus halotolerans]|uniref:Flagellar hook-associated protein 2 n=1 Tax=Fervidibacillus halotolerans TaxID=2980027 RepID=A0A9E8RZV5_9BACI|nr:flagellar filament capping protein FliD [Fervidibacillus halotolerans]WAA12017.1 flagellar filament capping protein FliD [Fervidibacillus halotolerans]